MDPVMTLPTMEPTWRKWIAENLMNNQNPEHLIAILIQHGHDPNLAQSEVHIASVHPYVEAGRSYSRKIQKRDWMFDTYRKLNNLAGRNTNIERRSNLSREEFLQSYYSANRPVIITDKVGDWPASKLWKPDYLKAQYGHHEIELQADRESDELFEINSDRLRYTMSFSDYVDTLLAVGRSNNFYMTANNTNKNLPLLKDVNKDIIPMTEYLTDYAVTGDNNSLGFFWFGPPGTLTPLHHDLTNNFMAQVVGSKRIKMISSHQLPSVYNHFHCYSEVDLDNIDYNRFPQFRNVEILDLTLNAGEVLFLPIGWWHHVEGLEMSITMTYTSFVFDNYFTERYTTYNTI